MWCCVHGPDQSISQNLWGVIGSYYIAKTFLIVCKVLLDMYIRNNTKCQSH